jgi:nucleoside phosphorylase
MAPLLGSAIQTLVVVVALKQEEREFLRVFSGSKRVGDLFSVHELHIAGGVRTFLIRSGPGKANASAATAIGIAAHSPDLVLSAGIAGACSSAVTCGTIVVAKDVVFHDLRYVGAGKNSLRRSSFYVGERFIRCSRFSCWRGGNGIVKAIRSAPNIVGRRSEWGRIASGDQFVWSPEARARICAETGALAVDMESAAIAQMCRMARVKVTAVRVISDDFGTAPLESFARQNPSTVAVCTRECSLVVGEFAKLLKKAF